MSGGFQSDKEYLIRATLEFTRKYRVNTPHEATRGNPARMKEWCALVYAYKKEYDETWLDGSSYDRDRRERARRTDESSTRNAHEPRRGTEPDRERDH